MAAPRDIHTKAFVVPALGSPFVLKDVILDEVRQDEVLVDMKYTGICHTDIVVQTGGMPIGSYPAVLGHEGAGIVQSVGSGVKSVAVGDTVLLSFHTCGHCKACEADECGSCPGATEINFLKNARSGSDTRSPIRLADGTPSSLSKMAVVTEKSVVKVDARPDELKYLPPLGCGYLTGAGTVLNVLKPQQDESIMIIGMGAVGLAALMAAKALGVQRIIAVDLLDTKLQLASALGATDVINTAQSVGLETTVKNSMASGVNFVLDTTGVGMLLEASVKCLAHAGTLALVGVPSSQTNLSINALDLLVSCKRIIGVIEGRSNPHVLIPQLFQMFREGKMPIDRLAEIYPAQSLHIALQDLKSGQVSAPSTQYVSTS
ncbi:hypothetical protein N7468_010669 [Penicillium chermesinum]|uniref:Enoyl reductase (ER) domain-containing protein n=1 Tax=Penicillium chermesinum TaxID=63820 RepID=A0A9W9N838_9EURO|nr:uncharacterized protein N7468_010669 [Penicillium chermesinum]KAJ5214990.1 hypothetical protein N7468_010669 [Penicillium chermesinum]